MMNCRVRDAAVYVGSIMLCRGNSKSFSQASIMCPSCSAVPVARKSIGFATDEPGKSFSISASAFGPEIDGTSSLLFDNESVSITAGPPAWVIIAMRLPCNSGCIKIPATVASSSLPLQRTIPALRKSASMATSLLARAPVCELAALLPASEPPLLMAAILHPLRISDDACLSRSQRE